MTPEEFKASVYKLFRYDKNAKSAPDVSIKKIYDYSLFAAERFQEVLPEVYGDIPLSDLATIISMTTQEVLYDNVLKAQALKNEPAPIQYSLS